MMERAKELFLLHFGSFMSMRQAGVYEAYKQFEIDREVENEWYNECIDSCTKQLSIRDWDAAASLLAIIKVHNNERIIKNVVAFVTKQLMSADSIVKLMYAEHILEMIKAMRQTVSDSVRFEAYEAALHLLEDIMKKPLVVDPGHELSLFKLRDKRSLNNRAQISIDTIKNDGYWKE
ncbi:hypothetical protein [Paenibacillus sp. BIHB 4019]|nr:hypothetical protein [Paenibacillus sp. BIHB 4019]